MNRGERKTEQKGVWALEPGPTEGDWVRVHGTDPVTWGVQLGNEGEVSEQETDL